MKLDFEGFAKFEGGHPAAAVDQAETKVADFAETEQGGEKGPNVNQDDQPEKCAASVKRDE